MDTKEYVLGVLRNESRNLENINDRLTEQTIRLLHAGIGLCTESGEFIDAIKKFIYYGKPLDRTNLIEELGDLFWYLGVASDALGVSFDEIMQINHNKLMARYSNGFSSEEAQKRDLNKEREILDQGVQSGR